jgi:hypothetical protein
MLKQNNGEAPQILSTEDLLAKMREGIKEVHEIRMRSAVFPVRVLSVDEVNAIRREAIRVTATTGGDETDSALCVQKATLKLASTLNLGGVPSVTDKMLSMMNLDEVLYLYNEYIRVMDSVNPNLDFIPPEKFKELVEALKKNIVSPRDCSLLQLRVICSVFRDLIQRQDSQDTPVAN